jgi:hypothetical protein
MMNIRPKTAKILDINSFIHQWLYSPLLGPDSFFELRNHIHSR